MFIRRRHIALLVFLLVSGEAAAQSSATPSGPFDSLLTRSGLGVATTRIAALDEASRDSLRQKLSMVDGLTSLSCRDICGSFALQRTAYDSTRVPSDITAVYERASEFIAADALKEAVKTFYVAFALKKEYVSSEKERLEGNFHAAQRLQQEGKKDSVRLRIAMYRAENRSNPALQVLEKELQLERYYRSLSEELDAEEVRNEYERTHADPFTYRVAIAIGPEVDIAFNRKRPSVLVTDESGGRTLLAPKLAAADEQRFADVFPSVSVLFPFGPSAAWMAECSYREIELVEFAKRDELVADIPSFSSNFIRIRMLQAVVGVRYLSRPNIGMRTFVESGLGVNLSSSDEKRVLKVYDLTFTAQRQRNTTLLLPVSIGVEYVPSAGTAVYFSASFGGTAYLNRTMYTSNFSVHGRLQCHVVLW